MRDVELTQELLGVLTEPPLVEEPARRHALDVAEHEILGNGHVHDTAGDVTILRDDTDAGGRHGTRAAGRDARPADRDAAGREREQARQQAADRLLAIPLAPAEPRDLPASGAEG